MKSQSILKELFRGDFYVFWSRIVLKLNLSTGTYSCLWNAPPPKTPIKRCQVILLVFNFSKTQEDLKKLAVIFKLQPISVFAIFSQTLVNACHDSVHYSVVTFNKTAPFIFRLHVWECI